jgi:hypothetical protein
MSSKHIDILITRPQKTDVAVADVYLQLHSFLISAQDTGKWSTLYLRRFTPEKNPVTHWIRGHVDLRPGLDVSEKSRVSYPCRNLTAACWVRSLVSKPHMHSLILA